MNDDWLEDTTDVLHCSMPPQVRAHIEELRDEVGRLRAAEVPLSANVGFAVVDDLLGTFVQETGWGGTTFVVREDAETQASWTRTDSGIATTVVALIPLTAWDRT